MVEQPSKYEQKSKLEESAQWLKYRYELIELKQRERETNQRIWIKWILLVIGIVALSSLVVLIYYLTFNTDSIARSDTTSIYSAIVFVAPIVSFSILLAAFFLGAFRGFNENDLKSVAKEAVKSAATISSQL